MYIYCIKINKKSYYLRIKQMLILLFILLLLVEIIFFQIFHLHE